MQVFQIGSSIKTPDKANDLDLIVVSDKPVDICLYTRTQWLEFKGHGLSDAGRRVVIFPPKMKGSKLNGDIRQLL